MFLHFFYICFTTYGILRIDRWCGPLVFEKHKPHERVIDTDPEIFCTKIYQRSCNWSSPAWIDNPYVEGKDSSMSQCRP